MEKEFILNIKLKEVLGFVEVFVLKFFIVRFCFQRTVKEQLGTYITTNDKKFKTHPKKIAPKRKSYRKTKKQQNQILKNVEILYEGNFFVPKDINNIDFFMKSKTGPCSL